MFWAVEFLFKGFFPQHTHFLRLFLSVLTTVGILPHECRQPEPQVLKTFAMASIVITSIVIYFIYWQTQLPRCKTVMYYGLYNYVRYLHFLGYTCNSENPVHILSTLTVPTIRLWTVLFIASHWSVSGWVKGGSQIWILSYSVFLGPW